MKQRAALLVAVVALVVSAGPRLVAADPAAGTVPSASAAPPVPVAPETLAAEPIPETKSAPPSAADWLNAPLVSVTRPLPPRCEARRLREWFRLRCLGRRPATASLFSGSRDGVAFWLAPDKDKPTEGVAEILMPLRRGDRRLIQVTELVEISPGLGVGDQAVGFFVSEQWLPAMAAPWVVVR